MARPSVDDVRDAIALRTARIGEVPFFFFLTFTNCLVKIFTRVHVQYTSAYEGYQQSYREDRTSGMARETMFENYRSK